MSVAPFDHLVGNDPVKNYLSRVLHQQKVSSCYLFSGPEQVGKSCFATAFAAAILKSPKVLTKNHPDLHIYRPEGKVGMHSIDSLRGFSKEVFLYPNEASKKVFIIEEAERMLPTSANALLKTLEEPSLDACIILISNDPSALLPTIVSRLAKVNFCPVAPGQIAKYLEKEHKIEARQAAFLASISQGSIGKAAHWAVNGMDPSRQRVLNYLATGAFDFVAVQALVTGLASELEKVKEAKTEQINDQYAKEYGQFSQLTATAKGALQKELEGILSLSITRECAFIFDTALSWFRDLHLLKARAKETLVLNLDYLDALKKNVGAAEILPLSSVEKAINRAQLALSRSSPLASTLQSFFLTLHP